MLEGLDKVDWASLHHAHGPATDVPDLIRALTSDDPEIRHKAFRHLYSNIWHQGTVYSASVYVVPFLVELLTEPTVPDKADILDLLVSLYEGDPYACQEDYLMPKVLAKQGHEFGERVDLAGYYGQEIKRRVIDGFEIYLNFTTAPLIRERARVAWLLGKCKPYTQQVVPQLLDLLQNEKELKVRDAVITAIGELVEPTREFLHLFDYLIKTEPPATSLSAALAYTNLVREQTPDYIIDKVITFFTRGKESEIGVIAYDELVCQALSNLGFEKGTAALLKALEVNQDAEETLVIAQFLLDKAFNTSKGTLLAIVGCYEDENGQAHQEYMIKGEPVLLNKHELSPLQLTILKSILDSEVFWQIENNLLALYGLPAEREALRQYLAS